MTRYPEIDDVLLVHRLLIQRFGGSYGLRDRGTLEWALARPQSGYYRDLIEEAAALWESLSQNHPFVDGYKRVAVVVTAAFLRLNGYRLTFTDTNAYLFLMELYESGRMRFGELDVWLRNHAVGE